jgi:signal-transduction protein with cAMP-binding, CBS, and nucleotidyltransferase domain
MGSAGVIGSTSVMGSVCDILQQKQSGALRCVEPQETVLNATQRMNEHGIGALLVMENDRLVGIFTERDVLRRVVAAELAPASVKVADVMTTNIACCTPETSIDDARNVFRQHRIRHLPIVNSDGNVLGMISIGDLNAYDAIHQEVTIHFLHEYLHGRV